MEKKPSRRIFQRLKTGFKMLLDDPQSLPNYHVPHLFKEYEWPTSEDLPPEPVLERLTNSQQKEFLVYLAQLECNWRVKNYLLLCFLVPTHCRTIMRGQWSELNENYWLPTTRKAMVRFQFLILPNGFYLEPDVMQILSDCKALAVSEGIESTYWFPSELDAQQPIANIDRHWRRVLQELGFTHTSLTRFRKMRWIF